MWRSRVKPFNSYALQVIEKSILGILHHNKEKNVCEQCGEKFTKYEYLISHARHIHNHPLVNAVGAAMNPSMKK
jgi:hypothetical protein